MYKCLKFFEKIFLSLKNLAVFSKLKNIFKIIPKNLFFKYIKNLNILKKNKENIQYIKKQNEYLLLRLKYFFSNFYYLVKKC